MDKKQILFKDLHRQLNNWDGKFSDLESRLFETGSELKTDYSETIEILHPEIKLVEMRMAELRESGEDACEELIYRLQKPIKVLKEAYAKASTRGHLEIDKSFE